MSPTVLVLIIKPPSYVSQCEALTQANLCENRKYLCFKCMYACCMCLCLTAEPVDGPFSPNPLLVNARYSGDVKESAQEVTCSSSVQDSPWEWRKRIWVEGCKNKANKTTSRGCRFEDIIFSTIQTIRYRSVPKKFIKIYDGSSERAKKWRSSHTLK